MSTGAPAKARAPGAEALAHLRTHTNIFSGERERERRARS